MKKANLPANQTEQVDAFLSKLDHPLKAEVQMIREIIKDVDHDITEQVKWNAPSFSYHGEYLLTFNLRARDRIHLVFHHPLIARVKSPFLQGEYKDRRMAYLANRDDVQAKAAVLQRALIDLIKLQHKVEEST